MTTTRSIVQIISGQKASDGDGVQLRRYIGSPELNHLDPFLLLDVFGSDKPQDYIGGFPSHPHRGFETVTYMMAGKMRHKDSIGTSGVIEAGGIQWMRAARGIIHSEMPEQEEGLLAGFQLWINLPASHKMADPEYQEFDKDHINIETRGAHTEIRVIAGKTRQGTQGVIKNELTSPIYWDVKLAEGTQFDDQIPENFNAFIYVMKGGLKIGDSDSILPKGALAVLSKGEMISIKAGSKSQFLLVAAKPLNEALARGGPFVMNTREEIQQAFRDYENGVLVSA